MIYRLALAAAFGLMTAGTALAQDAATNVDDCLKMAFDLAQSAEEKNLADDKLDKLEQLLTKMEGHCDANEFAEAAAVGKDIQAEIGQ